MKRTNQKPIKTDCSFLYKCPSEACGVDHWLFFREVSSPNFKIVCECGTIFSPKRIKNIKISYYKKKNLTKHINSIPVDTLEECGKVLVGYGFSKIEAKKLLKKAFDENQTLDSVGLIKLVLQSLEIKDV